MQSVPSHRTTRARRHLHPTRRPSRRQICRLHFPPPQLWLRHPLTRRQRRRRGLPLRAGHRSRGGPGRRRRRRTLPRRHGLSEHGARRLPRRPQCRVCSVPGSPLPFFCLLPNPHVCLMVLMLLLLTNTMLSGL